MKQKTPQILAWAIGLLVTAYLAWTAFQHHMTVLDTAAIALFSLAGTRTAVEHIARTITTTRKTGANR